MLMFKVAFSLFCAINQSAYRYSCLSFEQPIRFRLSVVYATLGISNTIEDNPYVNMPYCNVRGYTILSMKYLFLSSQQTLLLQEDTVQ